jgi:hypothetical protein
VSLNELINLHFGKVFSSDVVQDCMSDEVFFNVENPPALQSGESAIASAGDAITIPTITTAMGRMVIFFVSTTDKRLKHPFAGVKLREAIELTNAMTSVDGLLLQSVGEPALAILKPLTPSP